MPTVKDRKKLSYNSGKTPQRMVNSHTSAINTKARKTLKNVSTAPILNLLEYMNHITKSQISGTYAKIAKLKKRIQKSNATTKYAHLKRIS